MFGKIGCERKPVGRKLQFSIDKEKAMDILSKIANYLEEEEPMLIRCTDIGDWTLIATDVSGDAQQMSCSLCGGVVVDEVDLTDFIREQIPIDDLEEKKKFIDYVIEFEYEKLEIGKPDNVIFLTAPIELVNEMRAKRKETEGEAVSGDIH